MDNEVIEQKLEPLRRCFQHTEEKCPSSAESHAEDFDLQDIVALNLTRATQLYVDIGAHLIAGKDIPPSTTMGQTFDALAKFEVINTELAIRMRKAVGFRNIAVHNYEAINWQIAHTIATSHQKNFKNFAKAVIQKCGL